MGVLPLQFQDDTTRKTLELDGTETYQVIGEPDTQAIVTLVIQRYSKAEQDSNNKKEIGESIEIPMLCRLDTAEEVTIYEAGGVLQRFAQDFLESSAA